VALALATWGGVRVLAGTTALLILCVFTLVNLAVLALRRRPSPAGHFRAPTAFPVLGALSCAYLATPWSGRPVQEYGIAGVLLVVGLVLYAANRAFGRG
jgi:amino acid transporter